MSERMKKIIAGTLMITSLCVLVSGCGSSDDVAVATTAKVEVTTKEQTTTPEPTTTVPPTTEEPTTPEEITTKKVSVDDYEFKGRRFVVDMSLKEYFEGFIIEDGTVIKINDIWGSEYNDTERGAGVQTIVNAIWIEHNKEKAVAFVDMYWEPGADIFEVSINENAVIEYNEGHRWYFYYVGERNNGRAVFDIYEIE